MFGLKKEEEELLRNIKTPSEIQDFINKIPINHESDGRDTCYSPREVLKRNKCHCIEGAILAALLLRINGKKPLLVDLTASDDDFDHVIAVFKEGGRWGAISKTNHAVLRYREPVYKSIRELVMSYFHEYFDNFGKKNLRSYAGPLNLRIFDKDNWMSKRGSVWFIANHLADMKHKKILDEHQIKNLRRADKIEIKTGRIVEWKED